MSIFKELDSFLKDGESGKTVPQYRDELLFIFFINGLSYEDFVGSPVPYILKVVEKYGDMKQAEADAYKGKGKGGF